MDNFHSVLHLLLNMVPPSIESMSHSSSTSKDKDGNDDKNKSEEDDNISEIILHQKDSKCTSESVFIGMEHQEPSRSIYISFIRKNT